VTEFHTGHNSVIGETIESGVNLLSVNNVYIRDHSAA